MIPATLQVQTHTTDEPVLTVTLAVRTNDFEFYADKLRFRDHCNMERVKTVVVDDGSPKAVSKQIQEFCRQRNWSYVYLDTRSKDFSLARARNAGILATTTEWVFTDDADNIYEKDFFQRLLKEIEIVDQTPFTFLTIPHVYLSDEMSRRILAENDLESYVPFILSRMMLENPRGSDPRNIAIQHFAPASAMIAVRRKTAMLVGGYDTEFEGWGGEDRDFVFRLLMENPAIELPESFHVTKKWNMNDTHVYEGWRSLYRMLGDYMGKKGFYAYHIYHDWNQWRTPSGSNKNRDFAAERALYYSKNKKIPTLHDPDKPRDLIIGFNPFISNSRVRDVLVNPCIVDNPQTISPSIYVDQLLSGPVGSVVMWNPYNKEWDLDVYTALLERGIQPIVAERGALPDSIVFDKGGLCVESESYAEAAWNTPLSDEQSNLAKKHIERVRYGADALEKQSGRVGAFNVRKDLKIPDTCSVLFVPLQLYDDTVTRYFCESGRSYEDYILKLQQLCVSLPGDWVMVFKNHPLSLKKTDIPGGYCADAYHVNDLLEASTVVSTFNSGVGLLAQAFEKPVLYFGKCFYAIDGVNWRFDDVPTTLQFLKAPQTPDGEKIQRFYYWLNEVFYSFAKMEAHTKSGSNLSLRSDLKKITYSIVRIPGHPEKRFDASTFNPHLSTLFDVYRHHSITKRRSKKVAVHVPKAPIKAPIAKQTGTKGSKYRKLRRNPRAFFEDAKWPPLRMVSLLFSPR